MTLPSYDLSIDPLLRCLARYPEGARTGEIQEAPADELEHSEADRQELQVAVPGANFHEPHPEGRFLHGNLLAAQALVACHLFGPRVDSLDS